MRTAVLLAALGACLAPAAERRWIPPTAPNVEINGLPWFRENGGEFYRWPVRLQPTLRPAVWDLGKSPSGGRIRFRTDSGSLAVRLEYPRPPGMRNMHAFGQTGVDLYLDGEYAGSATADKDAKPGKTYEHVYTSDQPRAMRDVTLYLSLYMPVKVLEIGLDAGARVEKARPYALPKPVVFYGTSITQGGCASRAGMSYQAMLERMLNIDIVNLGFSGNGRGEPEVARAVAEIDAACYVLDFAQNNRTVESLGEVYKPFMATLREKHPETPIVAITPIYASRGGSRVESMRALIRKAVSERIAAGDNHLQLVEGTDLLGPARGDGLVDGVHPNDLGFRWMAEGLAERLRKVLGVVRFSPPLPASQ